MTQSSAGRAGPLTAHIDSVEVVETPGEDENVLKKGLSILKSRISTFDGRHAEYKIKVGHNGDVYSIQKRFSEFAAFHALLESRFGKTLPFDLPAKTAVRHFAPEALDDRKNALNAYLREVCKRHDFFECADVLAFFKPAGEGAFCRPPRGGPVADDRSSAPPAFLGGNTAPPVFSSGGTGNASAAALGPGVQGAKPGAPKPRADSEDDLVGWDR